MAGSRIGATKRAKERNRQERRAEKAQKKELRKQEKDLSVGEKPDGAPTITFDEDGQPQPLDFHDF